MVLIPTQEDSFNVLHCIALHLRATLRPVCFLFYTLVLSIILSETINSGKLFLRWLHLVVRVVHQFIVHPSLCLFVCVAGCIQSYSPGAALTQPVYVLVESCEADTCFVVVHLCHFKLLVMNLLQQTGRLLPSPFRPILSTSVFIF